MRSLLPPVHQARRRRFDWPARAVANQHAGPLLPHDEVGGSGAGEGLAPDPAIPSGSAGVGSVRAGRLEDRVGGHEAIVQARFRQGQEVALQEILGEPSFCPDEVVNLAIKRTEEKRVLETPLASAAGVTGASALLRLWPLVQEYHFCTVCYVCLDISTVDQLCSIVQPYDIVVHVPPYLQEAVGAMEREAVRAQAGAAVQAEDVLLVLAGLLVNYAGVEELLRQQRVQPPRELLLVRLTHKHLRLSLRRYPEQ